MTVVIEMGPSADYETLELLLIDPGGERPVPIVLLPHAPASGADAIARSLAESLEQGRWRLLPVPDLGGNVAAERDWHRDLWVAMPEADRDAVALITGATAGYLAPVLADRARTTVLVREPLAAVGMIGETGEPLPKRRVLERLAETPIDEIPPRLRRIANPQSRALLAPWHDPAELIVSLGPPDDADRWRDLLFGDLLPNLDAAAVERAPDVARALVRSLGGRPKPVVQAAKTIVDPALEIPGDREYTDLLLGLNWLDAELYARCFERSGEAG
jgi:hypothetical protein